MKNESVFILDHEQKKAVEYNQGPLLIVAGAGTGKTFVIVEKIKYLIQKKLAKPEEILALTFTEKAAFEMEERVDKSLPYGYFQMWISTFHAFADQILKEDLAQIGFNPNFRLMTEAESIIFLKKNLFLFNLKYFRPLGNPDKFLSALLQHFSRLQDEDVEPNQYLSWVRTQNSEEKMEKEKYFELAEAYKKYLDIKLKEGVMDFSDLVFYLLQLFRQRPNILKKYQQQFKYFLVDEFQDTNIGQYQLIKFLCPPKTKPKLTVVGDDSQSIYKFRGASVSNIIYFMKDYPQTKQITLKNNYRSNQTILDAAYRLIKQNDPDTLEAKLGISKNLIAQKQTKKDDTHTISFYLADRLENEAEFVAKKIFELRSNYKLSDFAILVRANNHSEAIIRALTRAGIPFQFLGPGMLFKQPEVKDLIAYLKLLYNLDDSASFYRVLTMEIFNIDNRDLYFLLAFTKKINRSIFQVLEILLSFYYPEIEQKEFMVYKQYLPLIKSETREKLFHLYQIINKHLGKIKTHSAGQILYWFLEDSGYLAKLIDFKTEKEEKIALNVSKFFDRIKTYETNYQETSIFSVVDYIEMSMALGESPLASQNDLSSYDAVNILTVHSAKGLEFNVVFLVNLSQGRFPSYEKSEMIPIPQSLIKEILPQGDFHQQEERRLFYVGLTRAIDRVFLSASQYYGEGRRKRRLSPFIIETIGDKAVNKIVSLKKEEKIQLSIFDFKPVEEKITRQKIDLSRLSFSQLETFKTCPLQYKYRYILRIPTIPGAAQSYGSSIHKTLELFYKEFLTNKQIDFNYLLSVFRQNWIPIGYSSAAHEIRMKAEGEKMLRAYFDKFHSSRLKIFSLEKFFKIKINSELSLTGKIDRVDQLPNNKIEIIDYKTGKKPNDKQLKKNLQLSIYALAANDPGLFRKRLSDIRCTFYFFQDMEKVSSEKNQEDLEKVKEEVLKIAAEIKKNKFLPNVGPWCDFCPFRINCEAWNT